MKNTFNHIHRFIWQYIFRFGKYAIKIDLLHVS